MVADFMGVIGLPMLVALVPLIVVDGVTRWVLVARSADDSGEGE